MLYKRSVAVAVTAVTGLLGLAACGDKTVAQAPPVQIPASQPASQPADTQTGGATGTDTGAGLTGDMSLLPGTAKSNNAPPGTGDWATSNSDDGTISPVAQKWVQLTAGKAGDLKPVVINGAGLTLYRFDKDTPNPSKSNCNDDCAVTWPPVVVAPGGKIFIAGIKKSDVGVVKRDDGQLQVTIKGWPAYRFNKDKKRGDTLGQGVKNTWFGLRPDGGKAGQQSGSAPSSKDNGDAQAAPATSVVLFDDANFSDSGASQGVAGQGCKNVARPGVASSLAAPGRLKLWSEKDCKGSSVVVNGDVEDLSTVNFDDKVASVFLG